MCGCVHDVCVDDGCSTISKTSIQNCNDPIHELGKIKCSV